MKEEDIGSVTRWIRQAKAGDEAGLERIWERYFGQVVQYVRSRLGTRWRKARDEEDVALSVFDGLWRGVKAGRFPRLDDRDNLWKILVGVAARKAADVVRDERCQKRGGGNVMDETTLRDAEGDLSGAGLERALASDPTPEFALMVAEECERRLSTLKDPMLRRIALLKLEGFENEEIKVEIGCALRTIERKLMRIRKEWSREGLAHE
jgi:DNA-directed RNA polymerase specialized sigma24 family protein